MNSCIDLAQFLLTKTCQDEVEISSELKDDSLIIFARTANKDHSVLLSNSGRNICAINSLIRNIGFTKNLKVEVIIQENA